MSEPLEEQNAGQLPLLVLDGSDGPIQTSELLEVHPTLGLSSPKTSSVDLTS